MLGAGNFRSVQAAVDVDEGFAFLGEPASFGVGQPFGVCQALGDLPVALDIRQIGGAGNQCEIPAASLGCASHLHQLHAVASGV